MTTPRPFHYCRICHRNFTDYEWKKHRFNPKHKQRLEDKLADVEVSLEHLLSPTDDVTLQDLDFDATSFECYFCEDYSLLKNAAEEGHDSTASDVYVSLNLSLLHFIFAFSAIILTPPPLDQHGDMDTLGGRETSRSCAALLCRVLAATTLSAPQVLAQEVAAQVQIGSVRACQTST